MSEPKPFHMALSGVAIPDLLDMSYDKANEDYAQKTCYATLRLLGYSRADGEEATNNAKGTAKERLFKITGVRQ